MAFSLNCMPDAVLQPLFKRRPGKHTDRLLLAELRLSFDGLQSTQNRRTRFQKADLQRRVNLLPLLGFVQASNAFSRPAPVIQV